jgi:site-specific DNA recombinase
MRAAIYARISSDRKGAGLGVDRQVADCRALVERRGWDLIEVYVDNDISAYSGKPRPAYRAMMAALTRGEIEAIVTYNPDRLYRREQDLAAFVDAVQAAGALVATTSGGDYDLNTADGRMFARMAGIAAIHQSERAAERIKRKQQEILEKGGVSGGGARPYGYADDRVTVVEEEAEVIREATRRVLAGESVFGVCEGLNRRGVPAASGGLWKQVKLKRILRSGRIAGMREHEGVDVVKAVWPAIITTGESIRLRAILTPGRSTARPRHLLTGILQCSRCGRPMGSGGSSADGIRSYACRRLDGGCGTTINAQHVEAQVIAELMPRLDAAPLMHRNEPEDPDVARIAEAQARIKEAGEQKMSLVTYQAFVAPLEREIADAEKRLTAKRPAQFRQMVQSFRSWWKPDDTERWNRLTPEQQRVCVTSLIERIDVAPTGVTPRYRPDRVNIVWR